MNHLEPLETRVLMSATLRGAVLDINGTAAADAVVVAFNRGSNQLVTIVNGRRQAFSAVGVREVDIETFAGNDRVTVRGNVTVNTDIDLGGGNDIAFGGRGRDDIDGNGGDDIILGRAGNDDLDGDGDDDRLFGGAGNDTLDGGAGNDTLSGGPGRDYFDDVQGGDTLVDFAPGADRRDLADADDLDDTAFLNPRITVINRAW